MVAQEQLVQSWWRREQIWIGIVSEEPLHFAARFWGEWAFDYGTLTNYSFLMRVCLQIFDSSLPKFLTQFPLPFDQFLVSSCQSRLVSRTGKLWVLTSLTLFVTFSNSTSFWPFLANFSVFYYYYSYSRPVPGFWVALWMVPWHKCNSSVSRRGLLALRSIAETLRIEKWV